MASFAVAVIDQVTDYNFYLLVTAFILVSILNLFTLRKFLKATVKVPKQVIENDFDPLVQKLWFLNLFKKMSQGL